MIAKNHGDGKPFFVYLAYQNNHFPLQAPAKYLKDNEGKYLEGWDKVREERLANQKKLGIMPTSAELSPRSPKVKAWDELNSTEKSYEAKKMQVFGADGQAMDVSIGKVLDYLKKIGEYDNTLIVFTTDNGGESERAEELNLTPDIKANVQRYLASLNMSEANLGNWDTFVTYGPGWAQVSNTPFSGFKGTLSEGGIRVPLLMKVPADSNHGYKDPLVTGLDLVPTFFAYANATYPGTLNGIKLEPLNGKSMLPIIEQKADKIHGDNETLPIEYFGAEAVIKGKWKAINLPRELGGNGQWSLYDLSKDPQERTDLAKTQPKLIKELITAYNEFSNKTNIIPPDFAVLGLSIPDKTAIDG
jgi:arylsulfatase